MKKKIKFCLVYRDMWQSSGKYQPRVEQLKAVAPQIIEMGCFDRVETNGGAFEQVQGVDITRSFCSLNDHRNLELSIKYAKAAGMVSQAALSITHSPVRTVDYYIGVVDKMVKYSTDEICLKDMAGVGRPVMQGIPQDAFPDELAKSHRTGK